MNIIGACFSAVYLSIFLWYAKGEHWRKLVIALVACEHGAVLGFGAIILLLSGANRVLALGLVCVACNVIMCVRQRGGLATSRRRSR